MDYNPLSYNTSNQLLGSPVSSFSYDKNGNMLSKAVAAGTSMYTWDFENRLLSATVPSGTSTSTNVTFRYDPFGRRIEKIAPSGATVYLYDGANVVAEVSTAGIVAASYVQGAGIDEPLAMQRGGYVGYYNADALGSVTSLTNTAGKTISSYVYRAFGSTTATEGIFNPFRYTAREQDPETDLYYYRARYYDPSIGRFLSEDPIRFWGGVDFYKYVENDPVNSTDPSGNKTHWHGYWCGGNWTGGLEEEYNPDHVKLYLQPKDGDLLDAACMRHDKCYYDCRHNNPCDAEKRRSCMRDCNTDLLNQVPKNDPDTRAVKYGISIGWWWPDAGTNEHCGCKDKGK
jgi:RHS repeat-associated protein